ERIEQALQAAFPEARMARVDRDSTRRRCAAEKIFAAAEKGNIDILVGTQMLSKGHDFPRLTLVGVVNADGAMFSADFRAAERLVAQMMQVAGRAGRAHLPGRVLIQTRFAAHPLYQAVARHDYAGFAALALRERDAMHLPPFSYLAVLRAEARHASMLREFMEQAASAAKPFLGEGLQVWDPVPPTLSRKAGFERMQLVAQATQRKTLQEFLTAWLPALPVARKIKWHLEVDPLEV
ncbi:MAG: primosomal protein N', partial [Betaproteobacteria bacterium]|nr:primosomal protein N' [Betaproteobacteria bacterium]